MLTVRINEHVSGKLRRLNPVRLRSGLARPRDDRPPATTTRLDVFPDLVHAVSNVRNICSATHPFRSLT